MSRKTSQKHSSCSLQTARRLWFVGGVPGKSHAACLEAVGERLNDLLVSANSLQCLSDPIPQLRPQPGNRRIPAYSCSNFKRGFLFEMQFFERDTNLKGPNSNFCTLSVFSRRLGNTLTVASEETRPAPRWRVEEGWPQCSSTLLLLYRAAQRMAL